MRPVAPDTHREMVHLASGLLGLSLLYVLVAGDRWDYLAHFVVGAGAAAVVVVVWELGGSHRLGAVLAVVGVSVASIAAELALFSALLVDWVDVGSGILGAAVVGAAAADARPASLGARAAGPLTVLVVLVGLVLRYGYDEPLGWP